MRTLTIVSQDELHAYQEYLKDVITFAEEYHCASPETTADAIGCAVVMDQVFTPRKKALWQSFAKKYSLDLSKKLSINTATGAIMTE